MSASGGVAESGPPARGAGPTERGATAWVALLLVGLSAALAALLEALFVPFYVGGIIVPLAVVAALVSNVVLPVLARTVVPTMLGVASPVVVWLIVMVGFGLVTRPEGDVILPGGSLQWVAYGVLLGGTVAGTATAIAITPRPGEPVRPRSVSA